MNTAPSTAEPIWTRMGPGCSQVQFHTLKQFIDYLYSDLLDFGAFIWRGQRCDSWKLEPTLERLERSASASAVQEYNFTQKHLENFKKASRGRRGTSGAAPGDENEWWALGQHHGLATPLLDWTTSPFVAAFFAFAETGADQTQFRAVLALHQPTIASIVKIARFEEEESREKRRKEVAAGAKVGALEQILLSAPAEPDLVFVRPQTDENQRLLAQGGLFTRSRTSQAIEDWVASHHDPTDERLTLLKCLVPDEERARCLRLLNRMNINPLSLFPDLTGASRYCNLYSEIENY